MRVVDKTNVGGGVSTVPHTHEGVFVFRPCGVCHSLHHFGAIYVGMLEVFEDSSLLVIRKED